MRSDTKKALDFMTDAMGEVCKAVTSLKETVDDGFKDIQQRLGEWHREQQQQEQRCEARYEAHEARIRRLEQAAREAPIPPS